MAFHSVPMTVANFCTVETSEPSVAEAIPASFGKAVKAPALSLMPCRASGSMWFRAFDLNTAGMPRRVASRICWMLLVKVAACSGDTSPVPGVPLTTLRRMKRLIICLFTMVSAVAGTAPPPAGFMVSINSMPAFSSSVMRPARSAARVSALRRQSS
jgi:hypothetical protein